MFMHKISTRMVCENGEHPILTTLEFEIERFNPYATEGCKEIRVEI